MRACASKCPGIPCYCEIENGMLKSPVERKALYAAWGRHVRSWYVHACKRALPHAFAPRRHETSACYVFNVCPNDTRRARFWRIAL